jgi:DNA-binding CsgD family transcriptional regulator
MNERLSDERDRQIVQAQQALMQAELKNRRLQEERLIEDKKKQLQQLIRQINPNFSHDQYWDEFRDTFGEVHGQFFDHLKAHSEDLTGNDLRLLSLIKLNLASGDIATLLGISQDSLRVSRYRLKKKLSLNNGESLTAFVHSL